MQEIQAISRNGETMPFTQLGLIEELTRALRDSAYVRPTPIQAEAIPTILEGRDVAGTAQTGTGKTAAFVLPMLQRLGAAKGRVRALILTPTRELAVQVEAAIRKYGRFSQLRSTAIYGGVSQRHQEEALRRGVEIIVATPGRLLDLMNQGLLNLSSVEILTLDEADRMLDMGFLPDIQEVVRRLPEDRQTLLFTATLPPEIQDLTCSIQKDPVMVRVGTYHAPAAAVEQVLYPVLPHQKSDLLLHLLDRETMKPLLVFTRTKHGADKLHSLLERRRFKVACIHSGRTQGQRQAALDGFKKSQYYILIATDIMARGIDVQDISHVVNFDLPNNTDDYIHRIGRTARADKSGVAYSFVSPEDEGTIRSIEKNIRKKLNRVKLEDFDYDVPSQAAFQAQRSTPGDRLRKGVSSPVSINTGSPKVFDRFAHGFNSSGRSADRGNHREALSGNSGRTRKSRNGSRNLGNSEQSNWVEGLIGTPSLEEKAELRRLQVKIFGSSLPQRRERHPSIRAGQTRDRYWQPVGAGRKSHAR
jgi:ATP-dependent RNA helicase RhlE